MPLATLTETIIDISDQHTLPAVQGAASLALPLATEEDYCNLQRKIGREPNDCLEYSAVRRAPGSVIDKLCLGYLDEKFWHNLVVRRFEEYPDQAWKLLLPLMATLTGRISYLTHSHSAIKISPRVCVLIYPFGWSTWTSLRVTGDHSFEDLADLVEELFKKPCIKPVDTPNPLMLYDYLIQLAAGIRADVFAGPRTNDVIDREPLMVMTVLAKYNSSPSLDGLTDQEKATLVRLVYPTRAVSYVEFPGYVRSLKPGDLYEFALTRDRKYFLWVQSLLAPVERNRKHLRCYHNNTFRSLERAGHLKSLLQEAALPKKLSPAIDQLTRIAAAELRKPFYKGKLLKDLVDSAEVTAALKPF